MTFRRVRYVVLLGLVAAMAGMCLALVWELATGARGTADPVEADRPEDLPRVSRGRPVDLPPPAVHAVLGADLEQQVSRVSLVFSFGAEAAADTGPSLREAESSAVRAWVHLELLELANEQAMPRGLFFSGATDETGRIGLTLPQGNYRVSVIADDPCLRPIDHGMRIDSGARGVEFRWMLPYWPGAIEGTVEASNDERVVGALVRLDPQARIPREVRTNESGHFRFEHVAGGRHRVRVRLGELAQRLVPPDDVFVTLADRARGRTGRAAAARAGAREEQEGVAPDSPEAGHGVARFVRFHLERAAVLEGCVRTVSGGFARGVRVRVESLEARRSSLQEVGPDGRYRFRGLPEGRYDVAVLHPWSEQVLAPARRLVLKVIEAPLRHDMVIPDPSGILEGRVQRLPAASSAGRGADSPRPEAGVLVRLRLSASGPPLEQLSGPEGRFRFESLWPGYYPIQVGDLEDRGLVVEPGSRHMIHVPPGETGWVSLPLVPEARISLTPLDDGGRAGEGWYTVEIAGSEPFLLQCRFPRSQRRLEVGGLPPGRFHVSLFTVGTDATVECRSEWFVRLDAGGHRKLVEDWSRLP